MQRRIRDLAVTAAALFVLIGLMISFNPLLRERAAGMADGMSGREWDASRSMVYRMVRPPLDLVSGYAAENVYLFWFLVVACVLVVFMTLMLRA